MCLGTLVFGQVNIERYRLRDANGRHKDPVTVLGLDASIRQSTSSRYAWGLRWVYPFRVGSRATGFVIGHYNYGRQNNTVYSNNYFSHIRLIGVTQRRMKPEWFAQYEDDAFTLTTHRELMGVGLRYAITETLLAGTGILHEWYTESGQKTMASVTRLSQYIQWVLPVGDQGQWDITLYVQPDITQWESLRYYIDTALVTPITTGISHQTTLTLKQYTNSAVFNEVELFLKSGVSLRFENLLNRKR